MVGMANKRPVQVAIIGAGMSGICMAAKLQDAGMDSFTIFEKAEDVGGTWRDNTYPGLTCDVPSRYYSYSFRPNPEWSRFLPPGPEIQAYFQQVARERGLHRHIRFGTNVTAARYENGTWRLTTPEGEKRSTCSSPRPECCGYPAIPTLRDEKRSPDRPFIPRAGTIPWSCPTSASGSSAPAQPVCRLWPNSAVKCGAQGLPTHRAVGLMPNPRYSRLTRAAQADGPR
ncbi:hypothetical protein MKUB_57650 [Mycobacterium kubicae]|uniref:NAD(P)-binding protein n=1 Tax=Mycobacterium kubicae TaxID=120959 RepID=A0ABQ1BXM0_9MYCO|nr:hypothetical protein MKUB_57650 [Mycobacterium kubicae]